MKKNLEQIAESFDMKFIIETLADYQIIRSEMPSLNGKFYLGIHDGVNQKIYLNTLQNVYRMQDTLFHELTHIFCDKMKIRLSERDVDELSQYIKNKYWRE